MFVISSNCYLSHNNHTRPLTSYELLQIVKSDELWQGDESVGNGDYQSEKNTENESLHGRNRLQACNEIFMHGDKIDKDKEDVELVNEHTTEREDKWVPSESEIVSS